MHRLAYLPLLMVCIPGLYRSPRDYFLFLFLPVVTIVPVYYEAKFIPGIPEFGFWSAALLPVAMVWVITKKMEWYRFSWLDAVILLHIFLIFFSQWSNSTYKEAQKVLFNDLMARFIPYLMAKACFSDPETRTKMLKVIVLVSSVIGIYLLYESRMFFNIFDEPLRKIWPSSVEWGSGMVRSGFKRAFGPFGHPICAGYFFAMVTPLAFWLWREGYFEESLWYPLGLRKDWGPKVILALFLIVFLLGPIGKISSASLIASASGLLILLVIVFMGAKKRIWGPAALLCCIAGLAGSISRGPVMGVLLGSMLVVFGWAQRRAVAAGVLLAVLVVSGTVFLPKFLTYISVDRSAAVTEDQRSAAYRREMLDNYKEVMNEKPLFGWGRFTVPIIKKQASIDNEYFSMALNYGKVPTAVYLMGMAWVLVRLCLYVANRRWNDPAGRLGWCIIAAWVAAGITQATVYAGTQTLQYFYILAGMGEALVMTKVRISAIVTRTSRSGKVGCGYNFSRTL